MAAVRQRVIRQRSRVVKVNDYNATPAHSGYRALHLIVSREGALVEGQLRTAGQQAWGTLVEDLDAAYELQLKDETGPGELLHFLRVYALALAERDHTGSIAPDTARNMNEARAIASDWLARRRMR